MAGEAPGRLDRSSLRLLADAAAGLGMAAAVRGSRLHLRHASGRETTLTWPKRVIPKSHIPRLLASSALLLPVPTRRFVPSAEPPFLPGCAKPDRSTRGEGFMAFRSPAEWRRRSAALDDSYVVQPLIEGREYRVTVCRSGVFAAAELAGRSGRRTRWRDEPRFARRLVAELLELVERLDRPGIGFDLIRADGGDYVLDVNLFPALSIHADGEPPRTSRAHFSRTGSR